MIRILASSIGTPTNPKRIANTFQSAEGIRIKDSTIRDYIDYLQDAFLIEEALRYDVKGRKYIGTETKYYFADMGIRAAILNLWLSAGFRREFEGGYYTYFYTAYPEKYGVVGVSEQTNEFICILYPYKEEEEKE